MPVDASARRASRSFERTTDAQRECIVEWLEQPGHFQLMTRPSSSVSTPDSSAGPQPKKGARVRRQLKKADGYRSLMRHVNRCTQSRWTQQVARSRFESLMASYKRARSQQQQQLGEDVSSVVTGSGKRKRAPTVASSFFDRIDALFAQLSTDNSPLVAIDMPDDLTTLAPHDESDLPRSSVPIEHAQFLQLERDRLSLAQQQLRARQQELELRERELRVQQEIQRQSLRVELVARLVALGKTPAQVQQYLAAMHE